MLRDHNFPVDTLYFDGEHDLPPEMLDPVMDWIMAIPAANEKET